MEFQEASMMNLTTLEGLISWVLTSQALWMLLGKLIIIMCDKFPHKLINLAL